MQTADAQHEVQDYAQRKIKMEFVSAIQKVRVPLILEAFLWNWEVVLVAVSVAGICVF